MAGSTTSIGRRALAGLIIGISSRGDAVETSDRQSLSPATSGRGIGPDPSTASRPETRNQAGGVPMAQLAPTYTSEDLLAGRKALIRGWSTGVEPEMVLVRARDALVWDAEGNEYIDCTAQAWSNNVGASDPRVIEAAIAQAREITHVRSNYDSVPLLLLAKRLAELAPGKLNRVGFCLHGSLAVEMAMKIAMKNRPAAGPFITLYDGYHGRSLATMAASWPHVN